jgi:hypothetical protein
MLSVQPVALQVQAEPLPQAVSVEAAAAFRLHHIVQNACHHSTRVVLV